MFRDRLSRPPAALLCSSLLETGSLTVWQPTNPSDPITSTLGSAPDVHTSFPCVLGPNEDPCLTHRCAHELPCVLGSNADPCLTHWATSGLCCFLYNVTERRSEITHTAHIQFLLYTTVHYNLERQNVLLMRNRRHRILIVLHSICHRHSWASHEQTCPLPSNFTGQTLRPRGDRNANYSNTPSAPK